MTLEGLAAARLLIIDGEQRALNQLERTLEDAGATSIYRARTATEAVELCRESRPDIIILDIDTPPHGGFELLGKIQALRPRGEPHIPVIMLTKEATGSVKKRALEAGVYDLLHKDHERTELVLRIRNIIENQRLYRQINRQKIWLEETVRVRTKQLQAARREVIERLALAGEYRDDDTGEHTRRVGRMSAFIAQALGEDPIFVESIGAAALLHDIGKIGIPDGLLLKPGSFTAEERVQMQQHTIIGAAILTNCVEPVMLMARLVALSHHEKWDGTGYPNSLRGADIPLAGRIVAVADAFDAMISERPYKRPIRRSDAIEEIVNCSSRQFDPKVVQGFLKVLEGHVQLPDLSFEKEVSAQMSLELGLE